VLLLSQVLAERTGYGRNKVRVKVVKLASFEDCHSIIDEKNPQKKIRDPAGIRALEKDCLETPAEFLILP